MQRSRTTPRGPVLLSDAARRNQRLLNIRRYNGPSRGYTSKHDMAIRTSTHIATGLRYSTQSSYTPRRSPRVSTLSVNNGVDARYSDIRPSSRGDKAGISSYSPRSSPRVDTLSVDNDVNARYTDKQASSRSDKASTSLETPKSPPRVKNTNNSEDTDTRHPDTKSNSKDKASLYTPRSTPRVTAPKSVEISVDPHHTDAESKITGERPDKSPVDTLKDKQDYLAADFDDFESKMKRTRAKMKKLLSKHDDVHERLQSDGSIIEDDGKHWEYFQQQNKLLNLAVSKLCKQEGIDVADLANGTEYEWRFRKSLPEEA